MDRRQQITDNTRLTRPQGLPSLQLHLVTRACPLWLATLEQAEAAGIPDPYWAFCWPGGQALARHVLSHPELVSAKHVLDFGAGSGLCGIAAMLAGAAQCTAADIDPVSQVAIAMNAAANNVHIGVTGEDLIGSDGPWDLVLVGDMFYEATLSKRVLPWLERLARRGADVLIGDPDRGFLNRDRLHKVATYQVFAEIDSDGTLQVTADVFRLNTRRH